VKLFVLNSKPADPNGYIVQALVRALKRQYHGELVLLDPADLGQIPQAPEAQALLVYGGEELQRIPPERLQAPFGRRAIWFTEDPYELAGNRERAALFSCVYTNDSGSAAAYPAAQHLPLAADADLLPLLPGRPPSRLAFFSGTAWPNRKRLLHDLHQRLEGSDALDLHLVANAVVETTAAERGLGPGLCFSPPIPITEFSLRAARSLCTLVIGRDFSGSGLHAYSRSPGPRLFEAGLSGSCQLVHAGEIPDMPADLLEGEHYLRFHHLEELCSLLQEARNAPQRFQAIGAAMAARIRGHHTYDARARVLLEALGQCRPTPIQLPAVPAASRRLLFVSHEQARPGFHHGGAGLCLETILAAAPADAEIRVLCRAGDDGRRFELLDAAGAVVGGFRCRQPVDEFSLHHPDFEQQFEQLLARWQPQLVHVNHLIGFTPAVLPLARRAGARVLLTLHDYFVLCDSWNLLDDQQRFCGIKDVFDPRCGRCTAARRPQFASVEPLQRRVLMAEVISHAHQLIVPSAAAEAQLRVVFPHLPPTAVIEPAPEAPAMPLPAASGEELVVLLPGNLAPNKGYAEFRRLLEQVELLELPIRFRVLGRADAWIRRQLAGQPRVELLGRYGPGEFAARAGGCDLALFLSPWPETYCITFDEWARAGRACFFIAIGALAEAHRQQALHPASRRFEPGAGDALLAALIQAATPAGLAQLRRPWPPASNASPSAGAAAGSGFGERHWQLFARVQARPQSLRPLPWQGRPHQRWGEGAGAAMALQPLRSRARWRARLRRLVYGLPAGYRLVRRWRQLRGG
jgi:glycosyltransferase involved in cell wall biosynthesis